MDDKVNLADKLGLFNEPYSPKIVGYLNDYKLAVVKVLGEFSSFLGASSTVPGRRRKHTSC